MALFGPVHISILTAIVLVSVLVAVVSRRSPESSGTIRSFLGWGLAVTEVIGWYFRYSNEGLRAGVNLPLQLCDLAVWTTVIGCITLDCLMIELGYFIGIAASGMALLQPDLCAPWPSWAAVGFLITHGGVVCAISAVVYGGAAQMRAWAVWRAFAFLLFWTGFVGLLDNSLGANYMYLRHKPAAVSLLDWLGPWPQYIELGALVAFVLFWTIWIPVRPTISMRHAEKTHRRRATFVRESFVDDSLRSL